MSKLFFKKSKINTKKRKLFNKSEKLNLFFQKLTEKNQQAFLQKG